MVVTLKNVKTFTGNEGMGLNADVYADGIKTFFFVDDASGGESDHMTIYDQGQYKALNAYANSLPEYPMVIDGKTYTNDGKPVMIQPDIDSLVNEAFEKLEQDKLMKKLNRKMLTCFLIGRKDYRGSYYEVNFKRPLAEVPLDYLQKAYDKYSAELKPHEIFWNTNFKALGIKEVATV